MLECSSYGKNVVVETNHPEEDRSYSSVFNNSPPGEGYAQSMLDSPQCWSADDYINPWIIIDLGMVVNVTGIVTQGRAPESAGNFLKTF